MVNGKAVTLKHLRALAAVVDSGSVTAAAGVLHLTPPAVSSQLRGLEQAIGARALERGPAGRVRLTPVGKELLETVRKIETALEHCFQRVTEMGIDDHAAPGGQREPEGQEPRAGTGGEDQASLSPDRLRPFARKPRQQR